MPKHIRASPGNGDTNRVNDACRTANLSTPEAPHVIHVSDVRRTSKTSRTKRFFSEPKLKIMSINIEGISSSKQELLQSICHNLKCDVLCIQEIHRNETQHRPKIQGMRLAIERPHSQYGSAIFVKSNLSVLSTEMTAENDTEILSVELTNCIVSSIYKPPNVQFHFKEPNNFRKQKTQFVIGDFNSHSTSWGYQKEDENGYLVHEWAESNQLSLLHDAKLPPSFISGRWRRGYNPDLIFTSDDINHQCIKKVGPPIPNTQHRPIICQVYAAIRPHSVPFRRRYNFKKANWWKFSKTLDEIVPDIEPVPESYNQFMAAVQKCSRSCIPRGCRIQYIKGLTPETTKQLSEYIELFEANPLGEDTINAGKCLINEISITKRAEWIKVMENLDLSRSSQNAWRLLRRLNTDPSNAQKHVNVTANQIAHQLIMNGKVKKHQKKSRTVINFEKESNEPLSPFVLDELNTAISTSKNGKAAGLDEIRSEQIKHFGMATREWLVTMFNNCLVQSKIPKMWRRAKVIALLKPGKDSEEAKNYRPVSLLCHLYKILERMILNRLTPIVDPQLIPQQAGFRPGKSCTGQVLNLTQHIEDGFEKCKITGVTFVDLSAAYDTVNHRIMQYKFFCMTKDSQLTRFIGTMLSNRRFFVEFQGQRSRWRPQRNGLPQGSVLSPLLFNIYTNDQPITPKTRSFIYADDLALAVQGNNFETVETHLTTALKSLSVYYDENQLRPNPSKTQVCAFHLRNKEAKRKLKVIWKNTLIEHCEKPKYLGVTLDRALTYKSHCLNTKQKVSTRNNLLQKLVSTQWGAQPQTVRTSALALSYSAAEYACPVWYRSKHAKQVDIALNKTCRLITGCMQPTPVEKLHYLAGIAPPDVRREVAADVERTKTEFSDLHPLFGHHPAISRLKSRNSFLHTSNILNHRPEEARLKLWKSKTIHLSNWMDAAEHLPPGYTEKWTIWKSLNRLRTNTGRSKDNLKKWGFLEDESKTCDCGVEQTTRHMLSCPLCPFSCNDEDLRQANDNAIDVARYWAKNI